MQKFCERGLAELFEIFVVCFVVAFQWSQCGPDVTPFLNTSPQTVRWELKLTPALICEGKESDALFSVALCYNFLPSPQCLHVILQAESLN